MPAPALPVRFFSVFKRLLLLCAILGAFASSQAASGPEISIDKRPARLERKTFPIGQPPSHPSFNPKEEAAFCDSRFGCVCDVGAEGRRFSTSEEPAKISRVNLTLTLDIAVWTPKNGPRMYVDHEEHHRAISEHYYQDAEGIARRAIDRELRVLAPLPPTSQRAALNRELRALQRRVMDAYLVETHGRASYAQDRFDDITKHGRAPVSNASALARAIADEEAHWAATAAKR
ncbi:hypothetical protein DB347_22910 [Opitutaceae bacterium EW11]|nr:hypothetical protein DB347_22910 [Opitutaceae bacterium EW11]